MTHEWLYNSRQPRQHWLYYGSRTVGLVYEVQPTSYSIYGEGFQRNPFARKFLGVMPTLQEAKDLLLTITASQQHENL